jgi:hypothetical protein
MMEHRKEDPMRFLVMLVAGSALLAASAAPARAVVGAHPSPTVSNPLTSVIHHKPGHQGGPPWARRGPDRDEWRDRREREYTIRDDWREERSYRREREYTTLCRTEYRTDFDPYTGAYVREPVRVCREGYGSGY